MDEEALAGVVTDNYFFNKEILTRQHPLARIKECTSEAGTMQRHAPYEDRLKRIYRPRVCLTEDANGQMTNLSQSEVVVYFDCYRLPKLGSRRMEHLHMETTKNESKKQSQRVLQQQVAFAERGLTLGDPSPIPYTGEVLELFLRRMPEEGYHSTEVLKFTCVVEDVTWGRIVFIDKDQQIQYRDSPNFGLVRCRLEQSFPRSVMIPPLYQFQRGKKIIPA